MKEDKEGEVEMIPSFSSSLPSKEGRKGSSINV